jgi:hypothetical protein
LSEILGHNRSETSTEIQSKFEGRMERAIDTWYKGVKKTGKQVDKTLHHAVPTSRCCLIFFYHCILLSSYNRESLVWPFFLSSIRFATAFLLLLPISKKDKGGNKSQFAMNQRGRKPWDSRIFSFSYVCY